MKMKIPSKKPAGLIEQFNPDSAQDKRVYNTLTMLAYLMAIINPDTGWPQKIKALIDATPQITLAEMGFPADWQRMQLWRD